MNVNESSELIMSRISIRIKMLSFLMRKKTLWLLRRRRMTSEALIKIMRLMDGYTDRIKRTVNAMTLNMKSLRIRNTRRRQMIANALLRRRFELMKIKDIKPKKR